jgi:cytochrome b561
MVRIPDQDLLFQFLMFQLHKTLGIVIFFLVAIRLGIRFRHGRPTFDRGLPLWQRRAAQMMHGLLYGLLMIVPVLGYLAAGTAAVRVPTLFLGIIPLPSLTGPSRYWFSVLSELHWSLTVVLILLACFHTAAAIFDHARGRTTLMAMWRNRAESRKP